MAEQLEFLDAEERLRWLSASGDPLERLWAVVDFEAFRPELEAALPRRTAAGAGVRPGRGADVSRPRAAGSTRCPTRGPNTSCATG
jgi:hypothetical protein